MQHFYCKFWIALTCSMPLVSFYPPWKHQKTRVFYVFRQYGKRPLAWNGLIKSMIFSSEVYSNGSSPYSDLLLKKGTNTGKFRKSSHWNYTCEPHNLSWYFLVTTTTTKDLSANTAMMATPECVKFVITLITFFAVLIRHPVLFEVVFEVTSALKQEAICSGPLPVHVNSWT